MTSDPRITAMLPILRGAGHWEDEAASLTRQLLAAADRAALEGAPELVAGLENTAKHMAYLAHDLGVAKTLAVMCREAAATLATQAAEIARLRDVARAVQSLMDLPADASMEDGTIADSALRDALATLDGKEPPT